jgi:hypothetical protein
MLDLFEFNVLVGLLESFEFSDIFSVLVNVFDEFGVEIT